MSDVLALASRLRVLSDEELGTLVRTRAIHPGGIKDFFDLAEALLGETAIRRQLMRLERSQLATLASASAISESGDGATVRDVADRLHSLGAPHPSADDVAERAAECAEMLLASVDDGRVTVYGSVREQLAAWPSVGLPGEAELASAPQPASLSSVPETERRFIDRLAADHAFAATTAMAQLLAALEHEPARELARGGIALPDTKRLAAAMSIDLEAVATYLAIAERASLVACERSQWMVTEAAGSWLLQTSSARWSSLSTAWRAALPGDLRRVLSERAHSLWGQGLTSFIEWLFPAGGEWMDERVAANTQHAELLGITARSAPSTPGSLLLAGNDSAAETSMAGLLPPEVEQVYLQHDLSVVAPGPLAPKMDARLRSLADIENRSLASSYRISATSLNRAMAAGETAASLREFLSEISLTGIPQPLEYLIDETATRYGRVRVGALDNTDPEHPAARSYLRSDDPGLLSTIVVDQSLAALGLTRASPDRVLSRAEMDMLFWAVSEARYPVAAERGDGTIVSLRRRHSRHDRVASGDDPADLLLQRLRLGGDPGAQANDKAWMVRQLEVAIKARAPLTVTIRMPNGSTDDFQLEPTSLAGGRLRARDRKSAIERTLPVSSITAVAPAR